jgi:hypothetical protein
METKKIEETNKLIAEFMGWVEKYPGENYVAFYLPKGWCPDFKITEDFEALEPKEMLFNSSWDWLMPVIRKIALENEETKLTNVIRLPSRNFGSLHLHSPIETVYKAVIEYIKCLN